MIQDPEDIPTVFRSFLRMDKLERNELQQQMKPGEMAFFYEYLSEAGPTSLNGMPTFSSVRTQSNVEVLEVQEHLDMQGVSRTRFPEGEQFLSSLSTTYLGHSRVMKWL
jgi:hypothetical protein